ncbi:hypothetical protein GCM10010172_68260 [Paractinoplanes ferrugineus]|uniref:Uncharacterized protein n=1 Tax=Paractinoplanes ferrugineus TaxID=113564 RepID=A0A919MA43_9ACTN|nr:hypothetical protein Afe05nite_40360 [Actinoplanes ferrugineus]
MKPSIVAYGGIVGTVSDKTGAVTLISSQVTAPFSTHILIDGYDIPNRSGPPLLCRPGAGAGAGAGAGGGGCREQTAVAWASIPEGARGGAAE